MRPGDVLYLPRGWYHDALAVDGPSLHVTLSVTPLYGRILFRLLEPAAMQDPAFRAWLPPADRDGGRGPGRAARRSGATPFGAGGQSGLPGRGGHGPAAAAAAPSGL